MEQEQEVWKPEVGQKAWYFDLSHKKIIREGRVTSRSKINDKFYRINHEHEWHHIQLYPTPEAALASIKVYDLDGKEVQGPRANDIFERKYEVALYALCDIGGVKTTLMPIEQSNALGVITKRLQKCVDISKQAIEKLKSMNTPNPDDVARAGAKFSQVKVAEKDHLYECQGCGYVDGISNYCSNCGVEFTSQPIGGLSFGDQVIVLKVNPEEAARPKLKLSENDIDRIIDQSLKAGVYQDGRIGDGC